MWEAGWKSMLRATILKLFLGSESAWEILDSVGFALRIRRRRRKFREGRHVKAFIWRARSSGHVHNGGLPSETPKITVD